MWHTELPSWDLWNYKARRRELGPRHNFSRLHNIIYIALCPFIRLWGFIYLVTYFSHESSSSWLVLYKCIEWLMPWGWVYKTFFYTGRLNIVLQSDFPFSIYLMSFLSLSLSLCLTNWFLFLTFFYASSLAVYFINKYTHCTGIAMRNNQKTTVPTTVPLHHIP